MQEFTIGYLLGCTSTIAVWIFLNARGKRDTAEPIERRVNNNHINTRRSLDRSEDRLDKARRVNTGLGDLNKSAIGRIEDTESIISGIIETGRRIGDKKPN